MPQRRLFYLDANGLSAFRWQSGILTAEGGFASDARGLDSFAEYISLNKQSLFYVLADVVEEGFQHDVIPHVQGADRTALLKRKVEQYFHGAPLSLGLTLGRETSGRRDDKILFVALTRNEHFEPWLAALRKAECQLAGVFSLPLTVSTLASAYAKKTPGHPSRFLLVTLTRGGLRQTFFDNGQLRFSRLTPLASDSLEEWATTCSVESSRIYQYLIGYRLINRGVALPTLILAHPAQSARFRESCRDSGELSFEFLDLLAEAGRYGLKTNPPDSRGEALFLHLMVRKTPPAQFAAAPERRLFRLWQTRVALNSASLVILVSCLIFSGKQLIQGYQLGEETNQIQQQAEQIGRQYSSALKTLPAMPFSTPSLRALIDRYDILVKHTATLEPMYRRISEALTQTARVDLDRIDWKVSNKPDETQPAPDSSGKQSSPEKGSLAGDYFVIADVYALLPIALKNDERTLKSIIEDFSTRLSKDGKAQVRILKLPFDVESTKTMKSSDESAATIEVPKFSLRIVQKL